MALAPREPSAAWLQPAPDALIGGADPAAVVAGRTGVRLAFIAALQFLPPRQRAVLVLRDVLAFRTAEVAEMLDTTNAAIDSALRRARAHMAAAGPVEDDLAEPDEEARRTLVDGYADAFTRADHGALVQMLRADVEMEMPPVPTWFTGTAFLATTEAVEVHDVHKELIVDSDGGDTIWTRAYDIVSPLPWPDTIGERVRRNTYTAEWAGRETELHERAEEFATPPGANPFEDPPDPERSAVLYGQSAAFVKAVRPAAEVVETICAEAEEILRTRPTTLIS